MTFFATEYLQQKTAAYGAPGPKALEEAQYNASYNAGDLLLHMADSRAPEVERSGKRWGLISGALGMTGLAGLAAAAEMPEMMGVGAASGALGGYRIGGHIGRTRASNRIDDESIQELAHIPVPGQGWTDDGVLQTYAFHTDRPPELLPPKEEVHGLSGLGYGRGGPGEVFHPFNEAWARYAAVKGGA